ncbi:MAG: glycosyltransferase family 87 protein [Bacteroidia bacterium]
MLKGKGRILTGIALIVFLCIESQGKGDFFIFSSAAKDLFSGENIYIKTYVDGYHYFYSVFFALLLHPFTYLPYAVSKFLWLSLNAFLAYRIYHILKELLPLAGLSRRQLMILKIAGIAFSFRFVFENLHYSQITILLLYLSLQGLQQVFTNKPIAGAFLIALGINIKLLPVVLLPYLVYRGFFKAGFFTVLFYAALMLVPVLFIGWQRNQELLGTWAALINPANENHVLDVGERSFHALSTLLSTLLVKNVPDVYALPIKRNITDISLEQLKIVLNVARLLLIAFSLYFFRSLPFKPAAGMQRRFREISYLLLLIPLIFPHQQHYAFLFICPAFVFCTYYLIRNKLTLGRFKYGFMLGSCVVIFLLCSLKIILGEFNEYYEHFKILTYAALWLIVVLAMSNPEEA